MIILINALYVLNAYLHSLSAHNNDGLTVFIACDKSCDKSCNGPGAGDCDACGEGYTESEDGMCEGNHDLLFYFLLKKHTQCRIWWRSTG